MRTNLQDWILTETRGCETVVEFGAGSFRRLEGVHPSVKRRVGIEISQVYIDASLDMKNTLKIKGDMRKFENLIADTYYDPLLRKDSPMNLHDCAMFIDSLEHLTKEDAIDLMSRVIAKFNKVILMIPEGNHPQTTDVTSHGQHEYQTHHSTWFEKDIRAMGFEDVIVDEYFHKGAVGKADGCIFATWEKNDQAN